MKITISNIHEVKSGNRLIFDGRVGIVEADKDWTGGLKCSGMSVKYIVENYNFVEVV